MCIYTQVSIPCFHGAGAKLALDGVAPPRSTRTRPTIEGRPAPEFCSTTPWSPLTSPPPDEHVSRTGAPAAELHHRAERGDASPPGAHARRLEIPPAEVPRHPLPDRPRYYLCCREPSGDFDEVIVAVTDDGRRRYFATRDGDRLAEVDEDSFERRRDGGARSMLELDERELGELEVELQFVRPVRGRDPIAEAADAAAAEAEAQAEAEAEAEALDAAAEAEAEAADAAEAETEEEAEPVPVVPGPDDEDLMMEEFEADMFETTTDQVELAEPVEAAPPARPAVEASVAAAVTSADTTPATDAGAQVSLAKGIAFVAHRGQLDRSGAAYFDHPGRVAERFDAIAESVEAAAAWLHDVLEDTTITAPELLEAGVRPEIVEVVELLTRTPDVSPDEYYARIRRHPAARRVKLADIDDNTARWRLRRLDYDMQLRLVEKYAYARRALGTD
jgi:hypothetical protein